MAKSFQARFVMKQRSDISTNDTGSEEDEGMEKGFSKEEVKLMEKFETKGYRIVAKDERQHLLTLERETDEIKC